MTESIQSSNQIQVKIVGMHCAACISKVEKKLTELPAINSVSANLATGFATIHVDNAIDLSVLSDKVDALGYSIGLSEVSFHIPDLDDASTIALIEKQIYNILGVQSVHSNLSQKKITVRYFENVTENGAIASAIDSAGYTAEVEEKGTSTLTPEEVHLLDYRQNLRRFIIALLGTLSVMLLPRLNLFPITTLYALSAVIVGVIIIGPGSKFFTRALKLAKHGSADMNTLIAIGAGTAFSYSVFILIQSGSTTHNFHLHFHTAAMILTFILLGRTLEAKAKSRASDSIGSLMRLSPEIAHRIIDGSEVDVLTSSLNTGDIVIVRSGEHIPIDGEIIEGSSAVNEAMITGESMPVDKSVNDEVFGGTLNSTGSFRMKVTKTGSDTALAGIVRLIEQAQGSKPPIQRLADKIAGVFVPIVLVIAAITFLIWYFIGSDPINQALTAAVAVLVIACPCAMGLATPTAVMVASGTAAKAGIVFKGGEVLELTSRIDTVVFDKTGTITHGEPEVTQVLAHNGYDGDRLIAIAASAEQGSNHPLARAIVRYAQDQHTKLLPIQDFKEYAGDGVESVVDGQQVRVGKPEWLSNSFELPEKVSTGTVLGISIDDRIAGWISISDTIRPTSRAAIQVLIDEGVTTVMLTGDNSQSAALVAEQVGIDEFNANLKPGDKVEYINQLQKSGRKVCMVGDGINDAPSLAQADIGCAIGSGSDTAIEAADIILLSSDPVGVPTALTLSRSTLKIIKQNLFWAFFYNSVGIPIAAGALYPLTGSLISPLYAAAAMALSSVSVVTNSLRLRSL